MRTHWLIGCIALTALACAAQPQDPDTAWKKAGADEELRHAFEQVVYRLDDTGRASYQGFNPAQRLTLEFDRDETWLKHPHGNVALRLAGYGYGGRLRTPQRVAPVASANRVEYRRGELREWYVNDSRGLEQGFTLARRPGVALNGEPLIIALAVAGELRPELAAEGDAVLLRSGRGAVLRYASLQAWDARGRTLASRLEVGEREVRLVVEDRGAEYPLVVDPLWNQQAELTAGDGAAGDNFGFSVSLSGDTAVVGAPGKNSSQGAAYVFVRSATTWNLQQELTASLDGAAGDQFGYSVSVDGNTTVVGAPSKTVGANSQQGVAYVFVRSGVTWSQQQELADLSGGAAGDQFGWSVSVSADSNVIGAPFKTVGANSQQGVAYVFVRSGATWSEQQELTASIDGAASDQFGTSVSVSGDTAVVGAPGAPTVGQGKAYVFFRTGANWNQQSELISSDGTAGDNFGSSVAVDADTAVAGAPLKTVGANTAQGEAYVFVRNGVTWSQQQKLIASNGNAIDFFGIAVSVSGNTVVVGAALKTVGANAAQGAAYVFVRSGASWSQQQELLADDGALGDQFGNFVSVNGSTTLVGAYNKTVGANPGQGAAYVFVLSQDVYQIGYAANLLAGDSVVNITNAGARGGFDPGGGICANVYVFDANQEMIDCCSCYVSPNDLRSLSANQDLVSNNLTLGKPPSVTIALLASDPTNGMNCDPSSPTAANLEQGMRAWGTTIHQGLPGKYQVTEQAFQNATLSVSELGKLTTYCSYIESNGSGHGTCNSCRAGAMSAAKQ